MPFLKKIKLFTLSFLLCSPSILPLPDNQNTSNINKEDIGLERETFETLMSISREHTQNIGFCIQQILQTLSSNKEQIQIPNKLQVIKTLAQLQDYIETLIQDTYTQNTKSALIEGVIFTNGIIHFLVNGLNNNFQEFDPTVLIKQIHRRSNLDISDETINSLVKKNTCMIKNLIYSSYRI